MNGLTLFNIENIKVKRDDHESLTSITVTVTDEDKKDFELLLFTDKSFMEIEYDND
jgi:hypothetical protein|tara:strand:+ start:328 stop:495 length:168 start_codon:yes stop_codon:yes gene_type:complete